MTEQNVTAIADEKAIENKIQEQVRNHDTDSALYSYALVILVAGMTFGGLCWAYHLFEEFLQWLTKVA
jgi:hypothetical protein